jgi:hypothetical protein
MLMFRAWEIRTSQIEKPASEQDIIPEIHFRHVEKIMLYLAKHVIQWIVLVVVKYWFIVSTKVRNWIGRNWPKIYNFFKKKTEDINEKKNTFVSRAVLESKIKIKRIREKVKREHEEVIDTSPKTEDQI